MIVFPHLLNLPRFCCAWGLFLMAQLIIIGEFHPPSGSQYTAREHNIHAPKTYYAFCGPQGNEKKRHVRFFVGFLLQYPYTTRTRVVLMEQTSSSFFIDSRKSLKVCKKMLFTLLNKCYLMFMCCINQILLRK